MTHDEENNPPIETDTDAGIHTEGPSISHYNLLNITRDLEDHF